VSWQLRGESLRSHDVDTIVSKQCDRVCRRVTAVDLSRNQLESFPSTLLRLTNLTALSLAYNDIAWLPPTFGGAFTKLQDLSLVCNPLRALPDPRQLSQLCVLRVSGVTCVPRSVPPLVVSRRAVLWLCDLVERSRRARAAALCVLVIRRFRVSVLSALPVEIVRCIARLIVTAE
jgi:hypothetical protein